MRSIYLKTFSLLLLITQSISAQGISSDPEKHEQEILQSGAIKVISNRADMISGGSALVELIPPSTVAFKDLEIELNGQTVKSAFARRSNHRVMGKVGEMSIGNNELVMRWQGGGQRILITNHPIGGPVFSGPQIQPWLCNTEEHGLGPALDKQCNGLTQINYLYQPTNNEPGDFAPYDPGNPPSDVANTTTDQGKTVPYIIRIERGTINRSIYKLAVLFDPAQPWAPWEPQAGWNRKLFIPFGGGCGTPHKQTAPLSEGNVLTGYQEVALHKFLSRGWMGVTSGLNALGQNCNEVVSAEAVMMLKEHIEEEYGSIRYTIGRGGSGGSIQQNNIASAYPGLLDGLTTDSTFPDAWTTFTDTTDCHLLNRYFLRTAPFKWLSSTGKASVMGKPSTRNCLTWSVLFGDLGNPRESGGFGIGIARPGCDLDKATTYHPSKNPDGVRCSVQDYQAAIWGPEKDSHAVEQLIDNRGVQYGLQALIDGKITPKQFIDLNARIGGLNTDWEFVPQRMTMSDEAAAIMYRASRHSDPRQLARVPIIDIRNNPNDKDIHQPYFSWVMRERLIAVNGGHGNHIIWEQGGEEYLDKAVFAVDRWLGAIESDTRNLSIETKVLANKPRDIVDTCWIDEKPVTDSHLCRETYPFSGDARIAAGGPLRSYHRKCQLKSLVREDYPVTFTDQQWQLLLDTFPEGVCDWSKEPIGYQPSIPWMDYSHGPGGTPAGPAPRSTNL